MSTSYLMNLLKFDEYTHYIDTPRLILETKDDRVIGEIKRYQNWNISIVGNGLDELSFDVYKYNDGVECPFWDDITTLKNVRILDYGRFEIEVSYADEAETIKSVHGVSLETELGQRYLYDFHVNDSEVSSVKDINDYNEKDFDENGRFIPTTLYNPSDVDHSLLHRVLLDKAPHWSIDHERMTKYVTMGVDEVCQGVEFFNREYTIDGTSIYDFLTGEVAEQTNVVFRFDTLKRKFWCESLEDCYDENRHLLQSGIGKDTTVYVDKDKLAKNINLDPDKDSVKNCFRIEGGDDVITNLVAAANTTGSRYIYRFADFQLNDMPQELRNKIAEYNDLVAEKQQLADETFVSLCEAYKQYYYYKSSMSPTISMDDPYNGDPKKQWEYIKKNIGVVGVYDTNVYADKAYAGISNNIEAIAKLFTDGRYSIEILNDTTSYVSSTKTWKGVIQVKRNTDESLVYPISNNGSYAATDYFTVKVDTDKSSSNPLIFTKQKIEKSLKDSGTYIVDLEIEGKTKKEEILPIFELYSLEQLNAFFAGYDAVLSIISPKVKDDKNVYGALYDLYTLRLNCCKSVINEREKQVKSELSKANALSTKLTDIQKSLNLSTFLGEELFNTLQKYIREDTYSNSNYISDGIEDYGELLQKAKDLIKAADKELKKACVLQRTASVPLNNLFLLKEFEPFWENFDLYNYIRVRTEDELLKLRVIGVDINGESIEEINVTFSDQIEAVDGTMTDLQSIIQQASSISSTYDATIMKAEKGSQARDLFTDMFNEGLNATNAMLTNNVNNEVTITSAGLIAKRMDDEGNYGDKQLRITGNGMYLTTDSWNSISEAIGEFYWNGEEKYGVLADSIIGNMILGKNIQVQSENTDILLNGSGIQIKNGNKVVFKANNTGDVSITGTINATSGSFSGNITSSATISGGTISGGTISGGTITIGNNFKVSNTGVLEATGAKISGEITATSGSFTGTVTADKGKIGDLSLSSGALTHTNGAYTITLRGVQDTKTNGVFYITDKSVEGKTTYPFRVNGDGSFSATKATLSDSVKITNNKLEISISEGNLVFNQKEDNAIGGLKFNSKDEKTGYNGDVTYNGTIFSIGLNESSKNKFVSSINFFKDSITIAQGEQGAPVSQIGSGIRIEKDHIYMYDEVTIMPNSTIVGAKGLIHAHADSANTAHTADSATKASQDGSGNNISSTYLKKANLGGMFKTQICYSDNVKITKGSTNSFSVTVVSMTNYKAISIVGAWVENGTGSGASYCNMYHFNLKDNTEVSKPAEATVNVSNKFYDKDVDVRVAVKVLYAYQE